MDGNYRSFTEVAGPRGPSKERYFQCTACGQVVQGWNASRQIQCCLDKDMIEIRPQVPDPFVRRTDA